VNQIVPNESSSLPFRSLFTVGPLPFWVSRLKPPPLNTVNVIVGPSTQGYFVWQKRRACLDALTYKPGGEGGGVRATYSADA
jgi:hypothetical protein